MRGKASAAQREINDPGWANASAGIWAAAAPARAAQEAMVKLGGRMHPWDVVVPWTAASIPGEPDTWTSPHFVVDYYDQRLAAFARCARSSRVPEGPDQD